MASKHTPTPWRTSINGQFSSEIETADGSLSVAMAHAKGHELLPDAYEAPDDDVSDANAAFIVRAVNAHDDLVEALKSAIGAWDRHYRKFPIDQTVEDDEFEAMQSARAALAKAEAA